jgi:hypothetical protein
MHLDLSGLDYLKPAKSERDVKKTPNNAVDNFVLSLFSGPRNFQRQVDVLDPVARSAGFSFAPTTVSAAGTARP